MREQLCIGIRDTPSIHAGQIYYWRNHKRLAAYEHKWIEVCTDNKFEHGSTLHTLPDVFDIHFRKLPDAY